jgi:chromosome segregation ATPase
MDSGDSDYGISRPRRTDDSDTESQLLADQEAVTLQSVNDALRKENSLLRAQFDQAVSLTQGMDDLHQKNAKLTTSIRSLEAEKADLARRLDIALRANEEFSSQLASEREAAIEHRSHETAEKDQEIARIRQQSESQIAQFRQRMLAAEQASEQNELRSRMLTSKLGHLYQSASSHFGASLSNLDSVIQALSKPLTPTLPVKADESPVSGQLESAIAKLRKDKLLLRAAKKESDSMKAEIAKLRREVSDWEKRAEQQSKEYSARLSDPVPDSRLSETVQDLTLKNESLRSEIALLKRQLSSDPHGSKPVKTATPLNLPLPELRKPDPTRELRIEIDNLKQGATEANQKLAASEAKREELLEKLSQAEARQSAVGIELDKSRHELNSLRLVHNEALNEMKTLRESLHAKPPISQTDGRAAKRLKSVVDQLEQTIKSQDNTIHDLVVERENERQRCEKVQAKLESIKSDLQDARSEKASLASELAEVKSIERIPLTPEDVMPLSAWRTSEFDPELSQQIEKIAATVSLQPASKLSQIYRAIAKFTSGAIRERDGELRNVLAELERIRGIVHEFAVNASIALSLNAVTYDNFVSGDHQTILRATLQTVQALDEAKRVSHQFKALGEHIVALFGEAPDLFAKVAEVKEVLDGHAEIAHRKSKKNRDLRAKLQDLRESTGREIEELSRENGERESAIADLEQKARENSDLIRRLKSELSQARQQIRELENEKADAETSLKSEHDRTVTGFQSESQAIQQQLTDHIGKLTAELEHAADSIEATEGALSKAQKQIQVLHRQIAEKDSALAELQSQKDAEIALLGAQSRSERENIIKSYEKAVAELRDQCDAHRSDLEKLSRDLAQSEDRGRRFRNAITELRRERAKLEAESKAANERHQRDSQVAQATIKSVSLAAEANAAQRVQELKAKFENETRRLYALAADEFRTFFNAAEAIDERSYRAMLARVKGEMKRLADSDAAVRRLAGAAPRQATDDAVAQLLVA